MTKSLARTLALDLTIVITVVMGWVVTYPSDSDPKNIKYVLWKNGLHSMNLDKATDTLICGWEPREIGCR